jgi:hypothetical protein
MSLLELLDEQEVAVSALVNSLDDINAEFEFDFKVIVDELDDVFFVPSERAETLERALSRLDALRLPKAIPVQGRWNALLSGVDRWQNRDEAQKRIEAVLQSRIDMVATYSSALGRLNMLHTKVVKLRDAVRDEAQRMIDNIDRHRPYHVRFVDLYTNYLTFRGTEVMDAIVEGLDDRVSQVEILKRYSQDAIRTTEKDIRDLQDAIKILKFMAPDVAPDTSGVEERPERLYHREASRIERNQSEIVRQTADAIRKRDKLLDKAAQQARRDSAVARWQQVLSLAASLGSLVQAISGANPGDMVEVNGTKWPVPPDILERATKGAKLDIIMQLSGANTHYVYSKSVWIGQD